MFIQYLDNLIDIPIELDSNLLTLVHHGWIDYKETSTTFKCSPIVQVVVKSKIDNKDGGFYCLGVIRSLNERLNPDLFHENNYYNSTLFAQWGEFIIRNIQSVNYHVAHLCKNIGQFYTETGDLEKALNAFQKMKDNYSILLSESIEDTIDLEEYVANSFSQLGDTYTSMGILTKQSLIMNNIACYQSKCTMNTQITSTSNIFWGFRIQNLAKHTTCWGIKETAWHFFDKFNQLKISSSMILTLNTEYEQSD